MILPYSAMKGQLLSKDVITLGEITLIDVQGIKAFNIRHFIQGILRHFI